MITKEQSHQLMRLVRKLIDAEVQYALILNGVLGDAKQASDLVADAQIDLITFVNTLRTRKQKEHESTRS